MRGETCSFHRRGASQSRDRQSSAPLSFGMLQLVSWQANVEACVKHVAQHALAMDLKVKDFLLLHGHFVEASTNDSIAGQRHHHKEKKVAGVDQM